jgi:hypothetical protein
MVISPLLVVGSTKSVAVHHWRPWAIREDGLLDTDIVKESRGFVLVLLPDLPQRGQQQRQPEGEADGGAHWGSLASALTQGRCCMGRGGTGGPKLWSVVAFAHIVRWGARAPGQSFAVWWPRLSPHQMDSWGESDASVEPRIHS